MMGGMPTDDGGPPVDVLAAFGLAGAAVALPGGQRRTWRVGPAVLKRLDCDRKTLVWQERC